jgi:hypothetical protein
MVFKKFFRKINMTKEIFVIDYRNTQPEDRFFSDIHLYDDVFLATMWNGTIYK